MIVADTHALIWWVTNPTLLSENARRTLDHENAIGFSAMSCWEVAMLAHRRRITIDEDVLDWLHSAIALPQVVILPLTIDVAVTAARLQVDFGDPADRLIVATALHHNVPLVTKDGKITSANVVTTIW